MSLFHRSFRNDAGVVVKTGKWYFDCRDHLGRLHRIPALNSKAASLELERKVKKLVDYRRANLELDQELTDFLETCYFRDKLVEWDIIPNIWAELNRPILEHITDWAESLGHNTRSHIKEARDKVIRLAIDWICFDRAMLNAEGLSAFPILCRLAQVAPLDMTQQMFLARCKTLHEIVTCIPGGHLKSLLEQAGCPKDEVKNLGSLKLLQALLNIVMRLNGQGEKKEAFASEIEPEGWQNRNKFMATLFLNNDLRIADAHESIAKSLNTLQEIGFDTGSISAGYGRALDFVVDGVISNLTTIAEQIEILLGAE